jgi:hypothetical protein
LALAAGAGGRTARHARLPVTRRTRRPERSLVVDQPSRTRTQVSRNTLAPNSRSICRRALAPISFSRVPPLPITMAFWPSRSTQITAPMRSRLPSSAKRSISTVVAYGSSSPSWRISCSRTSSPARNRWLRSVISSSPNIGASGSSLSTSRTSASRPLRFCAEIGARRRNRGLR